MVCHGAKQVAIDGIRNDSWGFDMTKAGSQGQAFGNGVYTGLSPHATRDYNTSEYPTGSYILGLLLVQSDQGWQHHHTRNYNGHFTAGFDEEPRVWPRASALPPTSGSLRSSSSFFRCPWLASVALPA